MTYDVKKELKEFYAPKVNPSIVNLPSTNYLGVFGKGNPNQKGGEYAKAVASLYTIAYTLKMSYKTDYQILGFVKYVVPPLEGFWWQPNIQGVDLHNKDNFHWISLIRLPDFILKENFEWAIKTATLKKNEDFSKVQFLTVEEGLCVQCLHIGPFKNEEETVRLMHEFANKQGYQIDLNERRRHHEIYLSDRRKVDPLKMKTIIRHPIRQGENK